ncbi:MAG: DUF2163 domain-containing protein [Hyphomicrobiaceae bacterium]
MRTLPVELSAALESGVTTLCWCWRITPRVGVPLGFTDHDRDIVFDGTTFEAASGFTASEMRESVGLSVDNLEVESALTSDRLSEARLAAGDFDEARIDIFRVDWTNPASRVLLRHGSLGEVRRSGSAFAAEVRGLAHYLQQVQGRVFQFSCDAEVGDQRCGVDLGNPLYKGAGIVASADGERRFATFDLAGFADGWFTRGLLTFTSGSNAGRASEIKRHQRHGAVATLELWQPPGASIAVGDSFVLTAGCDKQHATCRAKFSNVANYRGFPHMPGNDFLASPRIG